MPWCPKCGAEYREGFARCSECDVELVGERPDHLPVDEDENRIGPDWVRAGTFSSYEEAEIAQGFLRSNGIDAQVQDPRTHDPELAVGALDELNIMVAPADLAEARNLLERASRGEMELDEGETPGET